MHSKIVFLSIDDVMALHENTIQNEGGLSGVRNYGLLESAIMVPQQQFGGVYMHSELASMSAAYLFHLATNHPFLDGNKRTAALAALVFLDINKTKGYALPSQRNLEKIVLKVASGTLKKAELIEWFVKTCKKK